MNRTVPTFRPSKELTVAGVFWFSLLAAVRENVLVNGILLHAAADLACWRTAMLKVLCCRPPHFLVFLREG